MGFFRDLKNELRTFPGQIFNQRKLAAAKGICHRHSKFFSLACIVVI